MKEIITRTIILGTLFILIMSSVPIQASENKNDTITQSAQKTEENILGNITVKWPSLLFGITDCRPKIIANQNNTRDFYFTEIDGVIQMNFTVVCKHRQENKCLIPRWTQLNLMIWWNDEYIFNYATDFNNCISLAYEYCNFTVTPSDYINPPNTNGNNATMHVAIGVRGFPCGFIIRQVINWQDIIVHPKPIAS